MEGKISMKFNGTAVLVRNEAKKVFRFQVSDGFQRKHAVLFEHFCYFFCLKKVSPSGRTILKFEFENTKLKFQAKY